MGYLLEYFLTEASWELERQNLDENCKVVVLTRSHKDIFEKVKVNISHKSLIDFLKTFNEWGFVKNERYGKQYTVQADPIREAMYNPKSCKVYPAASTFSELEEALQRIKDLEEKSCKVEVELKQLQQVQLYNFTLETRLEAMSQEIEDLKSKSCNVYPNVEALQLYNFSSGWLQAVSDALGIPFPSRDIERDITKENKEILLGDFVVTPSPQGDNETEYQQFHIGNSATNIQSHSDPDVTDATPEHERTNNEPTLLDASSPVLFAGDARGIVDSASGASPLEVPGKVNKSQFRIPGIPMTTRNFEQGASNESNGHHGTGDLLQLPGIGITYDIGSNPLPGQQGLAHDHHGTSSIGDLPHRNGVLPGTHGDVSPLRDGNSNLGRLPGQAASTQTGEAALPNIPTQQQGQAVPQEQVTLQQEPCQALFPQTVPVPPAAVPPSLHPSQQATNAPVASTPPGGAQRGAGGDNPEKPKRTRTRKPTQERLPEPVFTLTEQQQHFWEMWCNIWFNQGVPLHLTKTAYGHVDTLAPIITTPEQLESLTRKARQDLEATTGIGRKTVQLGNCVYSLPGWRQDQPPEQRNGHQQTSSANITSYPTISGRRRLDDDVTTPIDYTVRAAFA